MNRERRGRWAMALVAAGIAFGVSAYGIQQMTAAEKLRVVVASRLPGTVHLLPATLETTQWGWFNNAQPPVLHIASGDTVVMETMMHSHNQIVPGTTIEEIKKLRTDNPGRGPHTITGPIFVEGAEPGDLLKVHINKIVPRAYGTNFNVPGMFGEFPKLFEDGQVKYFYLDLERNVAEFAAGIEIPLRPFPGTLAVARAEQGQYSTVPPGPYAGNMDIRDFTAGTTLYVPVFVPGALLWSGDSHATQGNGEVNLTALETAFRELNITVDVIKGKGKDRNYPRIETPTHWITMAFDTDLNKALVELKSETVKFLSEQRNIDVSEAGTVMATVSDCRISQVVNIKKGVHCLNPKDTKTRGIPERPKADNAEYFVTMATNADLNLAMDTASMAMINLLQDRKRLSRLDSYALASMTMDCRLGDMSDSSKSVHCLLPKSLWIATR